MKIQNAKFKNLFALNKTLGKPTAYRLIVELQASVCKRDVDGKDHYHNRPSLAKRVVFVLNQPSVEEIHNRIVNNVERIGDVAQEFTKCR